MKGKGRKLKITQTDELQTGGELRSRTLTTEFRGPTPMTQRRERPGTGRGRGKQGATVSVQGEESQEAGGHPSSERPGEQAQPGGSSLPHPGRRRGGGVPARCSLRCGPHTLSAGPLAARSPPHTLLLKGLLVMPLCVFTSAITVHFFRKGGGPCENFCLLKSSADFSGWVSSRRLANHSCASHALRETHTSPSF